MSIEPKDVRDGSIEFGNTMKIIEHFQRSTRKIPPKIVNSLTTSLLLSDDEKFSAWDITLVLTFIACLGKLNEHVVKLLRKMVDLWVKSEAAPYQVDAFLKVLITKSDTIDIARFNDPKFIGKCVNVATQQTDRNFSFCLQNHFNRLVSAKENLFSVKLLKSFLFLCTAGFCQPKFDRSFVNVF